MKYSEQDACPDCRTPAGGAAVCTVCRLDLTTPEVATVRQALSSADAWLARAARVPVAAPVPAQQVVGVPASPPVEQAGPPSPSVDTSAALPRHPGTPGTPLPRHPGGTSTAPRPRRRWTAGGVILTLGAGCLLVAGLIFLGVAWNLVGPTGRAIVLLAITAVVARFADRCAVKGLRASAHALWAVFLGLVTIDWFVGRALGFANLDAVPIDVAVLVWSGLVLVTAVVVGRRTQALLGTPLGLMTGAAGAVPLAAGPALSAQLWNVVEWPFWPAVVVMGVAGAVLVLVHRLAWRPSVVVAGSIGCVAAVVAVASAFLQALANPDLRDLVRDLDGFPLLLVALAAVVVGVVVDRPVLRGGASALATTSLGALVVLPCAARWEPAGGWLSAAAIVLLGSAVSALSLREAVLAWLRGVQLVVAGTAVVLLLVTTPWFVVAVDVLSRSAAGSSRVTAAQDLSSTAPTPFSTTVLAIVATVLVASLLLGTRWQGAEAYRRPLVRVASMLAALGVLAVVVDTVPRAWTTALALLLLGAALAALWRADERWGLVGPVVVMVAPAALLNAHTVLVVAAPAAAAILAAVAAVRRRGGSETVALVAAATWWVGLTVAPAADLLGGRARGIDLAVAVAASLLAVGALAVRRHPDVRLGLEAGAGAVLVLGVLIAAVAVEDVPRGYAWVALVLTVPGVVATAVAVLVPDRRAYVAVGSPLLGVAWVLRLLASDVGVIEAYTAPFAVVLLVAGVVALVRRPEISTRTALTAGVVLSLVPSLPQALAQPTSPRAGALAAVAVAFLAVGLVRRWQVPFVLGSGVVALLVLVNVGPYAWAVPRWFIIAAVGILLTLVGTTWEQRVREGRSAVQFLSTMR
ncbi:hypothetical protein ASD11_07620 [Aeromicrobium sp. Root495]|uniref:SCO7613 C-terminal domain-containing membrane protein n=1 Tax=Aeromicrobium sp. Root495 TaxID=1736550 RepID=UPI0006FF366D|nr:hypothetical protein [Aeromicrobium sp. Root495]KQY59425.1 hypothetical protein ASD11_07620 [Aeromicrobium sp. Root495]